MAARKSRPLCKTAACGAVSESLVVDPEGQMHTCWDLVGMDEESVKFVDAVSGKLSYNFGKAKWQNGHLTAQRIASMLSIKILFSGE